MMVTVLVRLSPLSFFLNPGVVLKEVRQRKRKELGRVRSI